MDDQTFSIEMMKSFKEHSVLDSFVFMSQKFETEFSKKLAFHFLEIFYNIFWYYSPVDFFLRHQNKISHLKHEADLKMIWKA